MEAISLNYARRVADLVACSEKDGIARRSPVASLVGVRAAR